MEMAKDNKTLVIKADLTQEFGVSSSGKSIIIASTEGNQAVTGMPTVKVGLNLYKPTKAGAVGSFGGWGTNIVGELSKDKKTLTLKVDITQKFGVSSSGKSEIIASTGGNISIDGHPEMKLGLNIYTPVAKK